MIANRKRRPRGTAGTRDRAAALMSAVSAKAPIPAPRARTISSARRPRYARAHALIPWSLVLRERAVAAVSAPPVTAGARRLLLVEEPDGEERHEERKGGRGAH